MSKLAHSNDETMIEIERKSRERGDATNPAELQSRLSAALDAYRIKKAKDLAYRAACRTFRDIDDDAHDAALLAREHACHVSIDADDAFEQAVTAFFDWLETQPDQTEERVA